MLPKQRRLVLVLVLALLIVVFAVLNVEPVTVNFGVISLELPLVILLLVALLLGSVLTLLVSTTSHNTLKKENEQLRAQLSKVTPSTGTKSLASHIIPKKN